MSTPKLLKSSVDQNLCSLSLSLSFRSEIKGESHTLQGNVRQPLSNAQSQQQTSSIEQSAPKISQGTCTRNYAEFILYFTSLIGNLHYILSSISNFLPAEISITKKDMATSPVVTQSFRTSALPKIPPLGLPSTPKASRWVKVSLVHSCFPLAMDGLLHTRI